MEKLISKLVWAVNLYSQAGDESNTRRQYFIKAKEARKIIMNEVIPELKHFRHNKPLHSDTKCTCDGEVSNNDIYCPVHGQSCYNLDI